MANNCSPGDGKLFVVPRSPTPPKRPAEVQKRTLRFADQSFFPLASILVAVVAFAAYAFLFGDREQAKDLLLIFLPPLTALMGAVSASLRR